MNKDREHKSNIVRMYGYFYFRNHLCITFESLSMNLYEFIKSNNFKGVSVGLICRFAIQILTSLKFLKAENIILILVNSFIYYALGFGGNGITFSQIAAQIITDLIQGKKNKDAAIFAFDR